VRKLRHLIKVCRNLATWWFRDGNK